MTKTQIQSMLMRAAHGTVGTVVPAYSAADQANIGLMTEMGLIGPRGGLTVRGVDARDRAMRQLENELFG